MPRVLCFIPLLPAIGPTFLSALAYTIVIGCTHEPVAP